MPDTTPKGLPYPVGSSAFDVAGDVEDLALALDAMPGISSLTQAQIDALGVGQKWAGRVVHNSTTGRLQVSNGSTFSDVAVVLTSSAAAPLGSASAGSAGTAARADHVHALPAPSAIGALEVSALSSAAPQPVAEAAAAGTSVSVSRADHVHAATAPLHQFLLIGA